MMKRPEPKTETPQTPPAPLSRVMREGSTTFCPRCGSTTSKKRFFRTIGKEICHNKKCLNSL